MKLSDFKPIALCCVILAAGGTGVQSWAAPAPVTYTITKVSSAPEASDEAASQSPALSYALRALAQVKEKYAADPRYSIFDVTVSEPAPNVLRLKGQTTSPNAIGELVMGLAPYGVRVENDVVLMPSDELLKKGAWGVITDATVAFQPHMGHAQTLRLGQPIRLLREVDAHTFLVAAPDGLIGTLDRSHFKEMDDTLMMAFNRADSVTVLAPEVVLYQDAQLTQPSTWTVQRLTRLLQTGEQTESYQVQVPTGQTLYVAKEAVTPTLAWQTQAEEARRQNPELYLKAVSQTAKDLVQNASAEVLKGLDEVALVRTSFGLHDLMLPSQLQTLAYMGNPIAVDGPFHNVMPGDLIFFGVAPKASTRAQIHHVAIALNRHEAVVGGYTNAAGQWVDAHVLRLTPKGTRDLGQVAWMIRVTPSELKNPCWVSSRSHGFYQTPPVSQTPCMRPYIKVLVN